MNAIKHNLTLSTEELEWLWEAVSEALESRTTWRHSPKNPEVQALQDLQDRLSDAVDDAHKHNRAHAMNTRSLSLRPLGRWSMLLSTEELEWLLEAVSEALDARTTWRHSLQNPEVQALQDLQDRLSDAVDGKF